MASRDGDGRVDCTRPAPSCRPAPREALLHGALGVAGGVVLAWTAGRVLETLARSLPPRAQHLARGAMLKPTFAVRALFAAVHGVERALQADDLVQARALLARDLVSRDTRALDQAQVAEAAIASLAENLSDSVIAPWLAARLGGLPAAYAYRFINTADAMLGYRTPELEWSGKPAARLDDLVNLLPARLTALLLVSCAAAGGGSTVGAATVMWRDHGLTPSPNGGWPMAAMAGALDCRITKRGVYALNADAAAPSVADLRRSRQIARAAVAAGGALLA
ncbi:MAG: CobD/CbiB family cobalamin biosynthesis protein [Gemmatimonadaceae bacterium]|nr:CobD/CbiB family cobalamin biosynthesis protein [Gemmatimonadaceae bacterium]